MNKSKADQNVTLNQQIYTSLCTKKKQGKQKKIKTYHH